MNLNELRIECGWSKNELSKMAHLDFNTLQKALNGTLISMSTASKLADAISKRLGRTIRVTDIDGLNVRL